MTAIVTGVKTRTGMIAVDQNARPGECSTEADARLASILQLAESSGLATGVVTTTRITHATPAATFSHSVERGWEDDAALPASAAAQGCRDIARQLVEFAVGDGPEVLLGGGRAQFLPRSSRDPEYPSRVGRRLDGRDLLREWAARRAGSRMVWNAAQLETVDTTQTPALLGLFEPDHLHFEHDRASDAAGEPSLAQMVQVAIARLAREPRGYFLLVEAGRIDHAHHGGNAYRALADTIALSDAVRTARELVSESDTLIVVTADHSHTLTIGGYSVRGNPILGKVREVNSGPDLAKDTGGLPYTTLSYANGPGQRASTLTADVPAAADSARNLRPDLGDTDTAAVDYRQEATVHLGSETHGGDDVAAYALGPAAFAVTGVLEQNVIYHLLVQATPSLRTRLCELGHCNAEGVPITPARPAELGSRQVSSSAE